MLASVERYCDDDQHTDIFLFVFHLAKNPQEKMPVLGYCLFVCGKLSEF